MKQTTQKVAKLARIALTEDELSRYSQSLEGVLAWVDQLKEVELSAVSTDALPGPQILNLRADEVCINNTVTDLMANAPESKFNMFSVPKVVE
jgi:aspartyl-tRNA(Asn)/glutamyl-tRNA(Gln) amidotransferase subunit C